MKRHWVWHTRKSCSFFKGKIIRPWKTQIQSGEFIHIFRGADLAFGDEDTFIIPCTVSGDAVAVVVVLFIQCAYFNFLLVSTKFNSMIQRILHRFICISCIVTALNINRTEKCIGFACVWSIVADTHLINFDVKLERAIIYNAGFRELFEALVDWVCVFEMYSV